MPYKLRKAPKRDLYWVIAQDGSKKSKEPIPLEQAKSQMKALYANEGYEPKKRVGKGYYKDKVQKILRENITDDVKKTLSKEKKKALLVLEKLTYEKLRKSPRSLMPYPKKYTSFLKSLGLPESHRPTEEELTAIYHDAENRLQQLRRQNNDLNGKLVSLSEYNVLPDFPINADEHIEDYQDRVERHILTRLKSIKDKADSFDKIQKNILKIDSLRYTKDEIIDDFEENLLDLIEDQSKLQEVLASNTNIIEVPGVDPETGKPIEYESAITFEDLKPNTKIIDLVDPKGEKESIWGRFYTEKEIEGLRKKSYKNPFTRASIAREIPSILKFKGIPLGKLEVRNKIDTNPSLYYNWFQHKLINPFKKSIFGIKTPFEKIDEEQESYFGEPGFTIVNPLAQPNAGSAPSERLPIVKYFQPSTGHTWYGQQGVLDKSTWHKPPGDIVAEYTVDENNKTVDVTGVGL